jgi:hypothetical protein
MASLIRPCSWKTGANAAEGPSGHRSYATRVFVVPQGDRGGDDAQVVDEPQAVLVRASEGRASAVTASGPLVSPSSGSPATLPMPTRCTASTSPRSRTPHWPSRTVGVARVATAILSADQRLRNGGRVPGCVCGSVTSADGGRRYLLNGRPADRPTPAGPADSPRRANVPYVTPARPPPEPGAAARDTASSVQNLQAHNAADDPGQHEQFVGADGLTVEDHGVRHRQDGADADPHRITRADRHGT